jgi:hypothetical protein
MFGVLKKLGLVHWLGIALALGLLLAAGAGSAQETAGSFTNPVSKGFAVSLISMGGSGATAEFDYFRVYRP